LVQLYRIGEDQIDSGDIRFQEFLARAHAAHSRPLCLCRKEVRLPLYVARRHQGYILARMPETGATHAPECDHFEAPLDLTGLGQVRDSAVIDDPDTGEARLKLAFPLKRGLARSSPAAMTNDKPSLKHNGRRLTMRGLLHVLWDRAQLTHWHPRMAGKRNWWIVRRALMNAIEGCIAKNDNLMRHVYVPEMYKLDDRENILARRHATLSPVRASSDTMMIVIGEVKDISSSQFGEKISLKHLPDWPLFMDADMAKRFHKRFAGDEELWQSTGDAGHLILAASFCLKRSGLAEIIEVALMPVTAEWLPYESIDEQALVRHAIEHRRHFVKGMRVDLDLGNPIANIMLTDTAPLATAVYLHGASPEQATDPALERLMAVRGVEHTLWAPGRSLPDPGRRHS